MAWTLGGATLTQATCQKDGIAYMEVEVDSLNSDANLAYTQVQCDLDRYSLVMTPEGQVLLRVGAIVNAPNGGTCLRYYGEATATAGTTFSQTPTQVALQPVTRGGC